MRCLAIFRTRRCAVLDVRLVFDHAGRLVTRIAGNQAVAGRTEVHIVLAIARTSRHGFGPDTDAFAVLPNIIEITRNLAFMHKVALLTTRNHSRRKGNSPRDPRDPQICAQHNITRQVCVSDTIATCQC